VGTDCRNNKSNNLSANINFTIHYYHFEAIIIVVLHVSKTKELIFLSLEKVISLSSEISCNFDTVYIEKLALKYNKF